MTQIGSLQYLEIMINSNMSIRNVLKESMKPTEGYFTPHQLCNDQHVFKNGVLEFKYCGDPLILHEKMKEIEPDLNHLGVTVYSTMPDTNTALITTDRQTVHKVKELMELHHFMLSAAHFGGNFDPKNPNLGNSSQPNNPGYGRDSGTSTGGSAFGGGGIFQGYSIDRLAGE